MKYIKPMLTIKRFSERDNIMTASGDGTNGVLGDAVSRGDGRQVYTESVSYKSLESAIGYN